MPRPAQPPAELGAYTAERASALSGVPRSTLHYWARHGIVSPSVSPEKVKLWSYADLFRLRLVYWLRRPKAKDDGRQIPATAMRKVRRAFAELDREGLDVWDAEGKDRVFVDADGHIYFRPAEGVIIDGTSRGQVIMDDVLDLIAPFATLDGVQGPDLVRPRPYLRIEPGKLSGSPHIVDTRLETSAVAALGARGFAIPDLKRLYPFASTRALRQALELEEQLDRNLKVAA